MVPLSESRKIDRRSIMDRRAILKSLAATTAALPILSGAATTPDTGKCDSPACSSDASAVRQFLSDFLRKEEFNLDRKPLVKLMQERGRACCRALTFRQDLITNSKGDVDKPGGTHGKNCGSGELHPRRQHDHPHLPSGKMRLRVESAAAAVSRRSLLRMFCGQQPVALCIGQRQNRHRQSAGIATPWRLALQVSDPTRIEMNPQSKMARGSICSKHRRMFL
jgi:hypothetical protein